MSVRVRWRTGGEAVIVAIDAERVTLRSSVPVPPGARVEGALEGDVPGAGALRVKVHACHRVEGEGFSMVGRPLDLSRALRDALIEAVSTGAVPTAPDVPTAPSRS